MAWKLTHCPADDEDRLNTFLTASWEPFAVTETDHIATVWLRRSAVPSDARVERLPRRSLDVREPL
jgi:hypothetical protein